MTGRHLGRRSLGAVLALALALLGASPAAAGGGPVRYSVTPVGLTIDLPAPDFCSAPVEIYTLVSREYEMDFMPHPDGTVTSIFSGTLIARVTNLTTGRTIVVNASGPGQIKTYADGSGTFYQEGHTLDFRPGDGIRLIDGRFDAIGDVARGAITDICTALGA